MCQVQPSTLPDDETSCAAFHATLSTFALSNVLNSSETELHRAPLRQCGARGHATRVDGDPDGVVPIRVDSLNVPQTRRARHCAIKLRRMVLVCVWEKKKGNWIGVVWCGVGGFDVRHHRERTTRRCATSTQSSIRRDSAERQPL